MLKVEGLTLDGTFDVIGFALHRGEILCLAGHVGARRTDVALSIFWVESATGGTIRAQGREMTMRKPRLAMEAGIAHVSEDRRKLGLAMPMPIRANISVATLGACLSKLGILDRDKERATAGSFRERLNIRAPDVDIEGGPLSGGNQQKVLLAKWLVMEPDILIVDTPTRGIDVGAKAEIHDLIREFAAAGGAALVISSDLPEVLALGDRILVMREGQLMGIIDAEDATREKSMVLASGQADTTQAP